MDVRLLRPKDIITNANISQDIICNNTVQNKLDASKNIINFENITEKCSRCQLAAISSIKFTHPPC